jgi:glycosyltransferase involved in cell wall biosynthesis
MKVLHLAPPADRGDALTAHSFIDEEIDALRESGVRCYVLSDVSGRRDVRRGVTVVGPRRLSQARKLFRAVSLVSHDASGVPAGAVRRPRQLAHALRLEDAAAELIHRERIDVVHSHFGWPGGFGGALAARSTGLPLVASLRGMDLLVREDLEYGLRRDPAYRAALDRLLRTADRTLYATTFLQRHGIAAGAPSSRAVVVRKGVDLTHFRPAPNRGVRQSALGLPGPLILGVGILGPRKGFEHLLDALAPLRDLPWTLALCGEGSLRDALEAKTRALGLTERVRFLGWVPRTAVNEYFGAADVFVHPALIEAAGNVILEAQASGCATIASDCGGPPEYLVDRQTGLIVPVENPAALTDALQTLLVRPELRAALGAAGRRAAEHHYAYSRMIDDLVAVYADVIRESASRQPERRLSTSVRPPASSTAV